MAEETKTLTLEELSKQLSSDLVSHFEPWQKTVDARLSDVPGAFEKAFAKYRIDGGPEKTGPVLDKDAKAPVAVLADSGPLASVMNLEVWNVPLGQAIVGGGVAILATELIDGMLVKQSKMVKGIIKLGAAGVAVKWGGKYLGSTGSKAVALLMAFDAVRDMTPLDDWMNRIANKLSGVIPTGGMGDQRGGGRSANDQANRVAKDYYARAFGR